MFLFLQHDPALCYHPNTNPNLNTVLPHKFYEATLSLFGILWWCFYLVPALLCLTFLLQLKSYLLMNS